MATPLANYKAEQHHFHQLLTPSGSLRILLFSGGSGSGKTTLLNYCAALCDEEGGQRLNLDFKNNVSSSAELLNYFGAMLRWKKCEQLVKTLQQFAAPEIDPHDEWRVEAALTDYLTSPPDLQTRREREAKLTNAWLADVANLSKPLLLIIDTYENASKNVQFWLEQQLLLRTTAVSNLRILLAGQQVPAVHMRWHQYQTQFHLSGVVTEVAEWQEYVHALGRIVESPTLLSICKGLKGDSQQIASIIKNLPLAARQQIMAAKPDLRLLRPKLVQYFDLDDVKELCFELRIDYQSLGQAGNKRSMIIELLLFIERHGRFEELLLNLRRMRPKVDWLT